MNSKVKGILDLVILLMLATAGFVAWGETPAGKHLNSKSIPIVEEKKITIESPLINEQVEGYVNLRGKANVPQSRVYVRLKDDVSGAVLIEDVTNVLSPAIGTPGPFTYEFNFGHYTEGRRFIIEVYSRDLKTGDEKNLVAVPVIYWKDRSKI